MIDPKTLVDMSMPEGLPAPVWFIEFFKWLGFTLHAVPMNLWYAGILVAMLLTVFGGEHGRRFAARLMAQMPIIIALGINFGIVPLLFIQVGFSQVFYPATILMAWFWFGVIVLLLPAYYSVYIYSLGQADATRPMPRWRRAAGWLAALLFPTIGFLFANAMSLVEHVKAWEGLWLKQTFHGAVLGVALNTGDPRLWPRWLLMFGIALMTTGAWVAVDSAWFGRRESGAYRLWATRFALKLSTLGAIWFAIAGSWYSFGTWEHATQQAMFFTPLVVLTVATALAPALPWFVLWRAARGESPIDRRQASFVGLLQVFVVAINAASRQVVQHLDIRPYYNIAEQPTAVQWSPLVLFVVVFVLGLGLVAWMILQVCKAGPSERQQDGK